MRIGINARLLLKNRLEGIGWHAFEIIQRLITDHPDDEFVLFYDRKKDILIPSGKNLKIITVYPPSRHPILIWWWTHSLRIACLKENLQVFYSPEVLMPVGLKIPVVITIHDLSPIALPQSLTVLNGWYYRWIIPKFAQVAAHIITVSQFSKSEIQKHLNIPEEKISVVYNAPRALFKPVDPAIQHQIRNHYTEGQPYFIYLGSIHIRKNVNLIIKAFDTFRSKNKVPYSLILSGNYMGQHTETSRAIHDSPYSDSIKQLGYVAEEEINNLLGSAVALINLSSYEGFGMPLVEAFQAGIPVIASNVSSYPEVAQEAALLVDPFKQEEIITAMNSAIAAPQEYIKSGLERAKYFDWKIAANRVWNQIILLGSKS